MTAEEVKLLTVPQKIQIMETIWADFRDRFEQTDIPQRVKDLLDRRRARVQEGAATIMDWETVRSTIGRE